MELGVEFNSYLAILKGHDGDHRIGFAAMDVGDHSLAVINGVVTIVAKEGFTNNGAIQNAAYKGIPCGLVNTSCVIVAIDHKGCLLACVAPSAKDRPTSASYIRLCNAHRQECVVGGRTLVNDFHVLPLVTLVDLSIQAVVSNLNDVAVECGGLVIFNSFLLVMA